LEDIDVCRQKDYDHVTSDIFEFKIRQKEIILAEVDGVVVGFLRLEYLWSHIPYIGLIVVDEDFRKKGIGRSILRFLEDYLISKGHDALYSSSQVNEEEPQAWHRHMGFEECGIISGINPKGIGEVFFRKAIGQR
jgi:ribosomal protein S18 acetylase RimI-like enzyme